MILLARFDGKEALLRAARALREAGVGGVETYSPVQLHEEGADTEASRLPLLVLAAGIAGCAGMFGLQWYAFSAGYPLNVGGRPDFAWEAYVPNAFEVGVLCAVVTAFAGFLVANRLPRPYSPVDESYAFREASRDGYFLAIRRAGDRERAVLMAQRPWRVEELDG